MTMTSADFLPAAVLKRKAVVYVRQSTQTQVQTNLESQRRQYELVDVARRRGFRDVEVIDDDLGRSASGMVARPGFERLVAWLCAGEVGAVLCFDASRLARNGRDWHHLLELCGLVEARVIDLDGVYDPCRPNDRLLLGMKGSISEFELSVIRSRMLDAKHGKAQRGELRISVPIGYIWHREIGLGFDPDLRVQEAVRVIFARFRQYGSARQVLLSLAAEQVHFPRPSDGKKLVNVEWTPIRYRSVISILKNPFYAGAYAYGKSQKRTAVVEGRARTTYKHRKPIDQWEVIIKEHHEGYIQWSEFERNQKLLAANAYGKTDGVKSGRGGRSLLPGFLLCGRCGRRLKVVYSGRGPGQPVYRCELPNQMLGRTRCIIFGASAWIVSSHASSCALWNRWRLRRHLKPSAGIWNYKASDDASWSWNCSRRTTRLRLPSDATRPAILIIGLSLHSLKKAGKQHCSVWKAARRDWPHWKRQAPPHQYPTLSGSQTTSRPPGMHQG
jgi:DNA invertase Pin-like site-specific DNA recombinase